MLNVLIGVCLAYVIALFAVAFWAERASMQGRANWLRSPMIYTLRCRFIAQGGRFMGPWDMRRDLVWSLSQFTLGPVLFCWGGGGFYENWCALAVHSVSHQLRI